MELLTGAEIEVLRLALAIVENDIIIFTSSDNETILNAEARQADLGEAFTNACLEVNMDLLRLKVAP